MDVATFEQLPHTLYQFRSITHMQRLMACRNIPHVREIECLSVSKRACCPNSPSQQRSEWGTDSVWHAYGDDTMMMGASQEMIHITDPCTQQRPSG